MSKAVGDFCINWSQASNVSRAFWSLVARFFFPGVKMPTTKKTQKLGEEKHSFSPPPTPPFFPRIDLNFSGGWTDLGTLFCESSEVILDDFVVCIIDINPFLHTYFQSKIDREKVKEKKKRRIELRIQQAVFQDSNIRFSRVWSLSLKNIIFPQRQRQQQQPRQNNQRRNWKRPRNLLNLYLWKNCVYLNHSSLCMEKITKYR